MGSAARTAAQLEVLVVGRAYGLTLPANWHDSVFASESSISSLIVPANRVPWEYRPEAWKSCRRSAWEKRWRRGAGRPRISFSTWTAGRRAHAD